VPSDEVSERWTQCLDAARVPGVSVYGPGEWSYNGALGDDAIGTSAQVQWWVCSQQYPQEDEYAWMLSAAQLEWLYDFFAQRHIPCLNTLGIEVDGFPPREEFLEFSRGSPSWLPYPSVMHPTPSSSEWTLIATRCPLPEMIDSLGLPGYPGEG
jgi:hypothetical protein